MARVADNTNSGLLMIALAAAGTFFGIIVAMLAYWISLQHELIEDVRAIQNANGNRLTAIESRLNNIDGNRLNSIESRLLNIESDVKRRSPQ